MKNQLIGIMILLNGWLINPVMAQSSGNKGYQLTLSINAYPAQYLYLGYHYGKMKALADSALVQPGGRAVFKGPAKLPGGIYFVVSPKKEILFELLLDKEQVFSMTVDSARLSQVQFIGSTDNTDFQAYTRFIQTRGNAISESQQLLLNAKSKADSSRIQEKLRDLNTEILNYRSDFIKKSPGSFLSTLFAALQEPQVPPAEKHPKGVYDSSFAYQYFKAHYWDGISFTDSRLLRTPIFEGRLDKYYRDLVSPEPDSIKKEIDGMLAKSKPDKDMYKYLLTHFVQLYINPQYMGQDAVFVHLFEKYINEKPEVDWFTEKYKKYMTDRAYSLMANLIGNPAWDMTMTDTTGKIRPLYEVSAPYVVLCFWDPTCSHCKEMVPHLDSMYQHKWKQQGIKIYGVMTDGGKENWLSYIRQNNLKDWIHVYQTEEQRETEKNSGKPGYRQLYDVYQTPVLYLLDNQKRIIAKKLTYQQMDDLITIKQQKNAANR
ncbi:thioredoxin-like domain-containing protein [Flavihumibacter profundi]|uniref:thioredoxin-like domain-containing protein n=1 Tax=Flavihumibacter profundi TaxID=2716883 RepID=UPI001CC758FD|nr:thioredoxin-like domain-containing protein [Flavihumibacter profundi]MBZ5858798.1 DUF5106 domain-containing protein [Flavihumibacter profundi]